MKQTRPCKPYDKNKYPLFSIIRAPYQALRRMHGHEGETKQMIKACRGWGARWGLVSNPKLKSAEHRLGASHAGLGAVQHPKLDIDPTGCPSNQSVTLGLATRIPP